MDPLSSGLVALAIVFIGIGAALWLTRHKKATSRFSRSLHATNLHDSRSSGFHYTPDLHDLHDDKKP